MSVMLVRLLPALLLSAMCCGEEVAGPDWLQQCEGHAPGEACRDPAAEVGEGDHMSCLQLRRKRWSLESIQHTLDWKRHGWPHPCRCPLTKSPAEPWPPCLKRLSITSFVAQYGNKWIESVKKMKKEPSVFSDDLNVAPRYRNSSWYDLMDIIHGTNYPQNSFAHMGVHFGTWHRVFMWLMDFGMNQVSDTPWETLLAPYWDWTNPVETTALYNAMGRDGNPFDHQCIAGPFAWPEYNISIKNGFYPLDVKQWQCVTRAISQEGTGVTDLEMASHLPSFPDVLNAMVDQRYDNQPYDDSAMGAMSFRNNLEGYGGWDNQGVDLVKSGHRMHGFHNIVHLDVGDTMATLVSPNDPIFWTHHGNIDRMLQTWLVQNGDMYGTGPPKREGETPLTRGYPAQIYKVEPACHNLTIQMSVNELPGLGMLIKIGDGSNASFTKFLLCSYAKDPSGNQIVGSGSYGKRLLLGFPKGSPLAAFMPKLSDLYIDPLVFKAKMEDGDLIYEAFTLTIKPKLPNGTQVNGIGVAPNHFEKALTFGLLQPSWFNAKNKVNDTFGLKTLHIPFGSGEQELKGLDFKAIAGTHGGHMKMDLEGYSPDHYSMPGYMKQIYNTPLTLQFQGSFFTPVQSCYNDLPGMEAFGCKTNGSSQAPKDQFPVAEGVFSGQTSQKSYADPLSNKTALLEITGHECLSYAELQAQGYVAEGQEASVAAQAMLPEAAKFCIVSGHFLGDPFKSEEMLRREWGQTFGHSPSSKPPSRDLGSVEMNEYLPASLAAGQYPLARSSRGSAGRFPEVADITDHIYIGARPGGNAQDLMQPFQQMGIDVTHGELFKVDTANYETLYSVPQ